MNPLIPIAALAVIVVASSRKRPAGAPAAPSPTGGVGSSLECGPYPPVVAGWRPVCVSHTGARFTSLTVPSRVVLWIQQGVRGESDESNMAVVEGEVVAQNTGGSQPLYTIRLVRVIKTFNLGAGVALPPVGTIFTAVRPQFVDTLDVAGTVATYLGGGTAPAGGGSSALGPGRGPGGPGGNRPPEQFPGENNGGQQFNEGLINNPEVAGWNYGAGVGACGGGMPFPVPMYYGNPYASVGYAQQYAYQQWLAQQRAAMMFRRAA